MNIVEITAENFDEMVDRHEMLVIDFWAEWCEPCKSFNKVVEGIAEEYPQFIFGSIDIDKQQELAEEFNIRSVPSVMILRNRVVVFAESGALSAKSLKDLLEQTKALDPEVLEKQRSDED